MTITADANRCRAGKPARNQKTQHESYVVDCGVILP